MSTIKWNRLHSLKISFRFKGTGKLLLYPTSLIIHWSFHPFLGIIDNPFVNLTCSVHWWIIYWNIQLFQRDFGLLNTFCEFKDYWCIQLFQQNLGSFIGVFSHSYECIDFPLMYPSFSMRFWIIHWSIQPFIWMFWLSINVSSVSNDVFDHS